MSEAFIMRRGGGGSKKITLSEMPVVATRTLSNAITAREGIGCAADNEYFVVAGGKDASGNMVKPITVFDRGGNKWTFNYQAGVDPGLFLTQGQLRMFGGMTQYNYPFTSANILSLGKALHNDVSVEPLTSLSQGRCAPSIARLGTKIIVVGGMAYDNVPQRTVEVYSLWDRNGQSGTYENNANIYLPLERAYCGISNLTSTSVLVAGGIDRDYSASGAVYLFNINNAGNVSRSGITGLSAAQYNPATANIYNEGYSYTLIGLGKGSPSTASGMISSKIVSTLDIYWYDGVATEPCSKFTSFTLPLTGAPSSAIAFSFGNIALFIVGYRGGSVKNKGYLVKVSPDGVGYASMEFDFKREEMQGGVIGNDVAYIAGGYKNGQATGDIEVIQLMRNVPIYPGMTYKLNYMSAEQTATSFTVHPLQNVVKLSGYMKI